MNENTKIIIWSACALLFIALVIVSVRNYAQNAAPWDVSSSTQTTNQAGTNSGANGNANANPSATGDVQKITLTLDENYDYKLIPGTLKQGVPVEMTVDLSRVVGCARAIVISDFGVRKSVKQGDNIIYFTPDKTGTFTIRCTMNMYRGSFEVTAQGTPSAISTATLSAQNTPAASTPTTAAGTTTPAKPADTASAPSCGMGGKSGGCGCSMM